jgi:hypothetical protein
MLVEAAHEAEKSITKRVIIESWANCGLFPWNPELIRQNMNNANPTATPSESKVGDMSKSITGSMIREFFGPGEESTAEVNPSRKNRGRKIFSANDLFKMIEEEKDEKVMKAAEKQEIKETRLKKKEALHLNRTVAARDFACRGSNHVDEAAPVWKSGKSWQWCSFCDVFGLCPKCLKSDRELMQEHEESHNDGMSE